MKYSKLRESRAYGGDLSKARIEALRSELEEIEADINDFGPEGFYSVSYEQMKKEFPMFMSLIVESFLKSFDLETKDSLKDLAHLNDEWKAGDLIMSDDWGALLAAAHKYVDGKNWGWNGVYSETNTSKTYGPEKSNKKEDEFSHGGTIPVVNMSKTDLQNIIDNTDHALSDDSWFDDFEDAWKLDGNADYLAEAADLEHAMFGDDADAFNQDFCNADGSCPKCGKQICECDKKLREGVEIISVKPGEGKLFNLKQKYAKDNKVVFVNGANLNQKKVDELQDKCHRGEIKRIIVDEYDRVNDDVRRALINLKCKVQGLEQEKLCEEKDENRVVKCQSHKLVAHSEDEKPLDCKMQKKPLEKPLAESIQDEINAITSKWNITEDMDAETQAKIQANLDKITADWGKDDDILVNHRADWNKLAASSGKNYKAPYNMARDNGSFNIKESIQDELNAITSKWDLAESFDDMSDKEFVEAFGKAMKEKHDRKCKGCLKEELEASWKEVEKNMNNAFKKGGERAIRDVDFMITNVLSKNKDNAKDVDEIYKRAYALRDKLMAADSDRTDESYGKKRIKEGVNAKMAAKLKARANEGQVKEGVSAQMADKLQNREAKDLDSKNWKTFVAKEMLQAFKQTIGAKPDDDNGGLYYFTILDTISNGQAVGSVKPFKIGKHELEDNGKLWIIGENKEFQSYQCKWAKGNGTTNSDSDVCCTAAIIETIPTNKEATEFKHKVTLWFDVDGWDYEEDHINRWVSLIFDTNGKYIEYKVQNGKKDRGTPEKQASLESEIAKYVEHNIDVVSMFNELINDIHDMAKRFGLE